MSSFIICGQYFVYIWVGKEFEMAYYYALAIMLGLTPILSQGFANNILEAKNLLVYRGVILLTLTSIGTLISYFILQKSGILEMILTVVFFMLMERVIMTFYYIKKANLDMKRYYKEILPLFLNCIIFTILTFTIKMYLSGTSFLNTAFLGAFYSILYLIGLLYFMTKYEKNLMKSMFSKIPYLKNYFK